MGLGLTCSEENGAMLMSTSNARLRTAVPGWTHRGTIDGADQGFFLAETNQSTQFFVDGWTNEHLRSPITISFTPTPKAELAATEGRAGAPVAVESELDGVGAYHDGWWAPKPDGTKALGWDRSRVHSITYTGSWGTIAIRAPKRVSASELTRLVAGVTLDQR